MPGIAALTICNPVFLKGRGFLMCARAFRTRPAFLGRGQSQSTDWRADRPRAVVGLGGWFLSPGESCDVGRTSQVVPSQTYT